MSLNPRIPNEGRVLTTFYDNNTRYPENIKKIKNIADTLIWNTKKTSFLNV